MTLAIFGATGQFGGDIIAALLERGTAPETILGLGRNDERLAELADQGLRTAQVDLEDLASVRPVLTGVAVALLISIGAPGQGLPLRTNAVTAAKAAGVGHLVYTSALPAPQHGSSWQRSTRPPKRSSGPPASLRRSSATAGTPRTTARTSPPPGSTASSPTASAPAASPRHRAATTPKPPPSS
jgi:NAD(P)H dehydrogenase (quinone)